MTTIFTYLCGLLLLLVPGYLFVKSAKYSFIVSLCVSPLVSIALYSIESIFYSKMNLSCSWELFFIPSVVLGAALLGGRLIVGMKIKSPELSHNKAVEDSRRNWLILCLYLLMGIGFTCGIFILNVGNLNTFSQAYDNAYHLTAIRGFLESGSWSAIDSSYYLSVTNFEIPITSEGFYPSAWHVVVAMLADFSGVSVAMAINVTNILFVTFVFPCGMFLLLHQLFRTNWVAVLFGTICIFAFEPFPWYIMAWGPIFPNMAALCATPIIIVLFMMGIEKGISNLQRVRSFVFFLVCLVGLVLIQPNCIFVVAIFLAPYCVFKIGDLNKLRQAGKRSVLIGRLVFIGFCLLVWIGLYQAPFMQDVVIFNWGATESRSQAIVDILTLSFTNIAQPILSVIVLIGFVCLVKSRTARWIVFPFIFFGIAYYFDISTEGVIKHLLTGFWYTDPRRIAACAVFCAIPLACTGLAWIYSTALRLLKRHNAEAKRTRIEILTVLGITFVFVFTNFYPSYEIKGYGSFTTAFADVRAYIYERYNGQIHADNAEIESIDKITEITNDSPIVNIPTDGSMYLYGLKGLNTFYRQPDRYGGDSETEDSKIIRESLDEFATNEKVQKAVGRSGVEYVLQLDQGIGQSGSTYHEAHNEELWTGISEIDENIPGFDLIFEEGDIKLYRIVSTS